MTTKAVLRWACCLAVAACAPAPRESEDGDGRHAGEPADRVVAEVRGLAAPVVEWADAMAEGSSAIVRTGEGLVAERFAAGLRMRAGETARDGIEIGPVRGRLGGVWLRPVDAAAQPAELAQGAVVYRGIHRSTDAVLVASGGRAEVFYVLRDQSAPRSWRWRLDGGAALSATQAGEAIELRDGNGRTRMRISAPLAIDARGRRVGVTVRLENGEACFTMMADPALTHPVLVDPLIEVFEWFDVTPVAPRRYSDHAMAHDEARGRVVLVGMHVDSERDTASRGETWEWDGSRWTHHDSAAQPPPRNGLAIAYDAARENTVLFGGGMVVPYSGFGLSDDTWQWDGVRWTEVMTETRPPARWDHAMAYDSTRRRIVLFGGYGTDGVRDDTWEWDGVRWIEVTPAAAPPARSNHAMAYDAARGRVVLFGGSLPDSDAAPFSDTWEWDGTTWTKRSSTSSPPARAYHAMVYDSAREGVVLFGGGEGNRYDPTGRRSDMWAWDGTEWTEVTPADRPSDRAQHAMAYDAARERTVLFGGYANYGDLGDTWEWNGTAWIEVLPPPSPAPRSGHTMIYDPVRERVVLFGGSARIETWEWDGERWTDVTPASSPTIRYGRSVWDAGRARQVLVVRDDDTGRIQTWERAGSEWHRRDSDFPVPIVSHIHDVVYDEARAQVLLFGFSCGEVCYRSETWTWDGATWTEMETPVAPSRRSVTMAYDRGTERVLLFGGSCGLDCSADDVWAWDGAEWTEIGSAPLPDIHGPAIYHEALGRIVMVGSDATWAWDGTGWVEMVSSGPPHREGHAIAYDTARDRLVLFGGHHDWTGFGDTWELACCGVGSDCSRDEDCTSRACVDGVCVPSDGSEDAGRSGPSTTDTPGSGCGCRVGSRGGWPALALALLVGGVALLRLGGARVDRRSNRRKGRSR